MISYFWTHLQPLGIVTMKLVVALKGLFALSERSKEILLFSMRFCYFGMTLTASLSNAFTLSFEVVILSFAFESRST